MLSPDKPLNVLHLTASLRTGGAERLILGLLKHSDRAYVYPHLYAFGTFATDSMLADFQALDLPQRIYESGRFYNPAIYRDLINYVQEQRIDLIHTHLCDGDIVGRLVGRYLGIPVVSTLQNTPGDFEQYRLDRRLLATGTARLLQPHLVGVSKRIAQGFIDAWKLPPERVSTIYNAVDLTRFLDIPVSSGRVNRGEPFTIIHIARHTPQKAQHVLLDGFQLLLKSEPNAELWMVGDGELRERLEAQAERLGIGQKVKFLGVRRDIPQLLAQADAFVLSSDWEGLPLSAIEAMAAARPVILTDVGGNRELVEPGHSGMITPPQDSVRLAKRMADLTQNRNLRLALGKGGRAKVRKGFDIQTVCLKYQQLYFQMATSALVGENRSVATV